MKLDRAADPMAFIERLRPLMIECINEVYEIPVKRPKVWSVENWRGV
jgi:hypothetical protein